MLNHSSVTDIAAAIAHYARMGFATRFVYGEPPFYAQVARDSAYLNLRHVDAGLFTPEFRAREEDPLAATIAVSDAKALFLEFQRAGLEFSQPLRVEPWGSRSFIVADPDGNLIMFVDSGSQASSGAKDGPEP